jgi:hypothetical protein
MASTGVKEATCWPIGSRQRDDLNERAAIYRTAAHKGVTALRVISFIGGAHTAAFSLEEAARQTAAGY